MFDIGITSTPCMPLLVCYGMRIRIEYGSPIGRCLSYYRMYTSGGMSGTDHYNSYWIMYNVSGMAYRELYWMYMWPDREIVQFNLWGMVRWYR